MTTLQIPNLPDIENMISDGLATIPFGAGNRTVVGGDSNTANPDNAQRNIWPSLTAAMTGQRIFLVHNSAVPGRVSADVLANLQAEVFAYNPNWYILMIGTNDVASGNGQIAAGITPAITQANITEIHRQVTAAGIRLVLCTIPPRDTNSNPTVANVHVKTEAHNAWIRDFAQKHGLPLIDVFRLNVDPGSGNYRAGYSGDGIHMDYFPHNRFAELGAGSIARLYPPFSPYLPESQADTRTYFNNPLFGGGGPSGAPSGWEAPTTSGGATTTCTQVQVPGWAGQGLKLTSDAVNAPSGIKIGRTTPISLPTGTLLAMCARIDLQMATQNACHAYVRLLALDAGGATLATTEPVSSWQTTLSNGVLYGTLTMPANTTQLRVEVECQGIGTLLIGQLGVVIGGLA